MELSPPVIIAMIVLLVTLFYFAYGPDDAKSPTAAAKGAKSSDASQPTTEQGAQVTYIGKLTRFIDNFVF